ncbi:MAG: helix-turn-helix domain-containing protein [Candidatus Methanomethylicaceae archaeon]
MQCEKIYSAALSNALKHKMQAEGLSEREVARRTGLSNTTVNNALKGKPVNINTLLCFARFLGVSPSSLLDSYLPDLDNGQATVTSFVQYLYQQRPKLAENFSRLVQQAEKNTDIYGVLVEALHYAAYRLGIPLEQGQT